MPTSYCCVLRLSHQLQIPIYSNMLKLLYFWIYKRLTIRFTLLLIFVHNQHVYFLIIQWLSTAYAGRDLSYEWRKYDVNNASLPSKWYNALKVLVNFSTKPFYDCYEVTPRKHPFELKCQILRPGVAKFRPNFAMAAAGEFYLDH